MTQLLKKFQKKSEISLVISKIKPIFALDFVYNIGIRHP